jgi:murein DD-endopeptidase MepM/ murein hydrolase activator NlpD
MRYLAAVLAALLVLATSGAFAAEGQESIEDARVERDEVREDKADAARELDAAKAADAEVADALRDVTESINAQQIELDDARRQLAVAVTVAEEAQADVDAADDDRRLIEDKLGSLAVIGFLNGADGNEQDILFGADDPTQALRQATMLQLADTDASDLLEELRAVIEDRAISTSIALSAVDEATLLELEMDGLLAELEDEKEVQAELKAELEVRIEEWRDTVAAIEAEERELTQFIREEEAKLLPPPPPPSPAASGSPSASGFQWPINARVTSEFGYRIHPIYGTRRMHAGIDLGASSGSPIVAAKGGTVISAGSLGGYGNAVVISHGGGISTVYAHQSRVAVSAGHSIGRGEVLGYVGSTGNSTGPHLHFEVRVNGAATNPRPDLP